jgi:hypothetical protein
MFLQEWLAMAESVISVGLWLRACVEGCASLACRRFIFCPTSATRTGFVSVSGFSLRVSQNSIPIFHEVARAFTDRAEVAFPGRQNEFREGWPESHRGAPAPMGSGVALTARAVMRLGLGAGKVLGQSTEAVHVASVIR